MKQTSIVLVSLALAACGVSGSETIPTSSTTPPSPPAPSSASTAKPESAEPVAPARQAGAPLVFTPPSDWVVVPPTGKMRVAQYTLPKAGADAEDAELVVYYFGAAGGGGVDANLARWASQFAQPDGRDSAELLQRSERKVAGMDVTEVRLSGTYVAETAPGSGERVNKPGFAMLAAIVKSDHGDYYAKLTGPAATVEHHAAAFRDFISRVK